MEKYIRLLNPKSVNYEADRIDGGLPMLTAQDVLLAMGFAKLSPLQDVLMRIKCFGATQSTLLDLKTLAVNRYEKELLGVSEAYHDSIMLVVLTEFCLVNATYNPTERARAKLCGFSSSTVRKHMVGRINSILEDLSGELALAQDKLIFQLNKSN